ncbi:MAG: phosphomannomutase/phosphoglucomutase [Venatoribacter sp.]
MPNAINPSIFRAYDIRGKVGRDLTPEVLYQIGRALGAQALAQGQQQFNLAWDGRLSSPELAKAMQEGLLDSGCDVHRLGMQPTGLLYFSTFVLAAPNGVMITGSHNPKDDNGIKMVLGQMALSADEIQALYQRIIENNLPSQARGKLTEQDISALYLHKISQSAQLARPLKVVIDAGNGVAGPLAIQLMKKLGVEAHFLHCDIDGNFPNHHPDPGIPENLATLQRTVLAEQADLGLAFDGDGDRTALVDNQGKIIWPDRLLMLLVQDILPYHPGRTVLYDVKCSSLLRPLVEQLGGQAVMGATGHSLMKKQMRQHNALLGGEFSGHLYLNEGWYGFDDGLYVAARLLQALSHYKQSSSEVFARFPEELSTPEITINSTDQRKFEIIECLAQDPAFLAGAQVFKVDGLRIEFEQGWGLVRASNTTPKLTLRFAGQNQAAINDIQTRFKQALKRQAPELEITF